MNKPHVLTINKKAVRVEGEKMTDVNSWSLYFGAFFPLVLSPPTRQISTSISTPTSQWVV